MDKQFLRSGVATMLMSIVFSVVFIEAGLRIMHYFQDKRTLSRALSRNLPKEKLGLMNNRFMVTLSDNETLVYEMRKNFSGTIMIFDNFFASTNSEGHRDRDYTIDKPQGSARIIGIGDSFMFGLGIDDGLNYLDQLEIILNEHADNADWEVINMSVPGYNTVMEVEMLSSHGLKYKPDIVILGYYKNDLEMPHFISNEENYLTLKKSFFLRFIKERIGILKARDKRYEVIAVDDEYTANMEIPRKYLNMVGWEPFETAVRRLKSLSEEHNFRVVVFIITDQRARLDDKAKQLFASLGFHVIDPYEVFSGYLKAKGRDRWTGSDLSVNERDPHPSALAHRMAAEYIYKEFIRLGIAAQ